jgi:hypothetical protein
MSEPIDFTKDGRRADDGFDSELVRRESWPVAASPSWSCRSTSGASRCTSTDADEAEVQVEVRHDPAAGGMWGQGISGVLSWIGQATAGPGGEPADLAAEAVRAAEITGRSPGGG